MFVAQFTDMDHMTLQYIYEMAVTIRAQDKHNLKVHKFKGTNTNK